MSTPRSRVGAVAAIGVGLLFIYDFPPEFFAWLWETVRSLPNSQFNLAEGNERSAQQIIGVFLVASSVVGWLIARWRRPRMATAASGTPTDKPGPTVAGSPEERRYALVATLGLLCVFSYWAYTAFWSGEALLKAELRDLTVQDRPAVTPLPAGDSPQQYWAGPVELDPSANPMRVVLGVSVPRARERVNYRVALVDDSGNVTWQENGTITHSATQADKQHNTVSSRRRKHISQASDVLTVERSGSYTVLADLDRVEEPELTIRGGVVKANPLVYAMFGGLMLYGVVGLVRATQERERASARR